MDQKLALEALKGLVGIEKEDSVFFHQRPLVKRIFSDNEIVIERGLNEIFALAFKKLNLQIATLALAAGVKKSERLKLVISRFHSNGALSHAKQDAEILKLALDFGFDVNAKLKDGNTLLHEALMFSNLDIIEIILKAKANPNARNRSGMTPVMLAAIEGDLPVLERLFQAGGDPWLTPPYRKNSLDLAITYHNVDCAEFIKVLPKPKLSFEPLFEKLRIFFWYEPLASYYVGDQIRKF